MNLNKRSFLKFLLVGTGVAAAGALGYKWFGKLFQGNKTDEVKVQENEVLKGLSEEVQKLTLKSTSSIPLGTPVGYVIEFENGKRLYTSGDTGLMAEMKTVIGDYYKPDVSILSVGNMSTMDFKAGAFAATLLGSQYVIAEHYHSFPKLADDLDGLGKEMAKYGMQNRYLKFVEGETKNVLGTKITWLGHSAWLFETPGGKRILTDPQPENNPKWPEQYKDLATLKPIDTILITHAHSDHMTSTDLRKLVDVFEKPIVVAQGEVAGWLKTVLPYNDIVGVNPGARFGKADLVKGGLSAEKAEKLGDVVVNMVGALHSSWGLPETPK